MTDWLDVKRPYGLPLTGNGRLWEAFLAAHEDTVQAKRERRRAEMTGDVETHHIDAIHKAQKREKAARAAYKATIPKGT